MVREGGGSIRLEPYGPLTCCASFTREGLQFVIAERAFCGPGKPDSESLYFLQYAGAFPTFYAAAREYLEPFRAAGVHMVFLFDNGLGVRYDKVGYW
jgi:hypothetical protein